MPIKIAKPTTSARRQMTTQDFAVLDKTERDKSLTAGKKQNAGRNSQGKIVVAHRGSGVKRLYRLVDFSQLKHEDDKAEVLAIEYDPNRSSFIAKLNYGDGSKSYILAPEGLKKGDIVICADSAAPKPGNRMRLKNIPLSSQIYNIELTAGRGGQICRSAGNYATLLGYDGKYAIIRLSSGESRKILADNFASIGVVSNIDHSKVVISKAGRTRWMGIRPTVRGKAKNPVDHPHGGGEGNTSIGLRYPKTPWGAPALGHRTRNRKKAGSQLILNRRKK